MKKEILFETLKNKYHKLPDFQKEVLQIMAIVYVPTPKKEIVNCFLKIGKSPNLLNSFVESEKTIDKLIQTDFILDNKFLGMQLEPEFSNWLFTEVAIKNPNLKIYRKIISELFPVDNCKFDDFTKYFRDFRIAFLLKETEKVSEILDSKISPNVKSDLFINASIPDFNFELFENTPYEDFAVDVAKFVSEKKIQNLIPTDDTIAFLEEKASIKKDVGVAQILAWHYLFKGQIDKLETYVSENSSFLSFLSPIVCFLKGDVENAKKLFDEELNFHKKARGLKKFCPEGPAGLFYCLISFVAGSDDEYPDVEIYNVIQYAFSNFHGNQQSAYCIFYAIYCLWDGDYLHSESMLKAGLNDIKELDIPAYFTLFIIPFFIKYQKRFKVNFNPEFLFEQLEKYLHSDYDFFRFQAYNILKKEKLIQDKLDFGELDKKIIDFSNLFDREITWQQKLSQLKNIVPEPVKEKRKARIIWRVSFCDTDFGYAEEAINFIPVQQIFGKTGKWSKGKIISLKRISDDNISGMSDVDRKIGKCIKKNRYWGKSNYVLNIGDSLDLFLKHPFLFLEEDPNRIAELIKEPLQLFVKKTKKDIKLSLSFDYGYFENRPNFNYLIIRETFSQIRVIQTDEFHNKIIKFIGPDNFLTFPIESEKEFKELVGKMSAGMIVHSDVTDDKNTEAVKADSKIHIHILPIRNGVRAEFFIRPFKDKGSYFKPGFGAASIISNISGITKQAERNLKTEKKNADKIVQKCPEFLFRKNDDYSFAFETPDEALEALSNLLEIKKDVVIEWPEGEKIKVVRNYDEDDVNFSVKKVNDWFELESEIKIDEKRIVSIKKLLEIAPNSRFIELDEGEFIALTERLREKLTSISDLAYFDDENIRIHPLNAHQIDDVLSDVDSFIPDDDWKLQIEKLNNAEKLQPELPSTLQAELRPYQLEGFEWLSKLSEWGVGACLADDMGLGKTVQALAVILQKAKNGPTLVVAPSSVCANWQKEANKFAPTLKPIIFGTGNRKKTLKNLKSFDLVISSYGLLLHEAELLTEVNWAATILDEAQFIKNYKAKRTKAAFNLKSDFKLITTGTPIENNLSELWTIFSFINPGLLGSQKDFFKKFGLPIEKYGDKKAAKSLKKSIRPFILRRTKSQVLDDLPPKTEINLMVDLSEEETAFYETLRRDAVEIIESLDEQNPGTVHLQILAELMKLRRACCHPSLVSENIKIESSKLKLFNEIVDELIANNHKALVFSQFVGHLTILKNELDKRKIKYQYLDGSTPSKKRQKLVDDFQAGEGDFFLISLKAGGTGLNLTAADYVIHTDPWWNPAVEDQASDRTHRIGQQRPVTVYRLITKNTIEEKIISLHKTKRALADSLLDGTDKTAKISTTELLNLLKM